MDNRHRFVLMDNVKLQHLVTELQLIGCCNPCVVRYLGVTDPQVYKTKEGAEKVLSHIIKEEPTMTAETLQTNGNDPKHLKHNACVACLGLLQDGVQDDWLSKIALNITQAGIEAASYCPSLSLPVSLQIRAYSIWFHLQQKFGDFLTPVKDLKPDGVNMKACWKWITSYSLKQKVDPSSEWGNDGNFKIEISVTYDDEEEECKTMRDFLVQIQGNKKRNADNVVSRSAVDGHLKRMESDVFMQHFQCPPSIPTKSVSLGPIHCLHEPIFIAGRYCKYSRELSQTPWLIDNVRKTEDSVEELMSKHILSILGASESKFSSSGREDVDVRMLGRGRPFVFEVIKPLRTIFSSQSMKCLQDQINSNTSLISVRDLQVVDKKQVSVLKTGEDSKSKVYSALCYLPGHEISSEYLKILNDYPLPITLKQKTPVRVLHRRSLATRERNIVEMRAESIPDEPEMFNLFLRTDAGTYVKEFVHGDFGRTLPNIGTILGVEADILALDVTEVALDWPPAIEDNL